MNTDTNLEILKDLYSEILWSAHKTYSLRDAITYTTDVETKKVYVSEINDYTLITYKLFNSFLSDKGYAYIDMLNYLKEYINKNKLEEYIAPCNFGKDYNSNCMYKIGIKLNPKYNNKVKELFSLLKLQGIIE